MDIQASRKVLQLIQQRRVTSSNPRYKMILHVAAKWLTANIKDEYDAISDWSHPLVVTIYGNNPPETPSIDGPASGRTGKMYEYTFLAADSNEDDISYFIDWGDDTSTGWTEFIASETSVGAKHTWAEQNTFTIKAKAKDIHGAESDWENLEVSMPKNLQPRNTTPLQVLERIMERFPVIAQLLQLPIFNKILNLK